jgi:hypothetical protein
MAIQFTDTSEEAALEFAKKMYGQNSDFTFVELQMAEKGFSDPVIDKAISHLQKIDLSLQRGKGMKKMIMGLSFIAVSIFFTWFTTNVWDFQYGYILYGGAVWGVMNFAKGVIMMW